MPLPAFLRISLRSAILLDDTVHNARRSSFFKGGDMSGTPIWKQTSMQSSRCANGSCPLRGRITCQALPVCLSVSYLSLLDTSSYPQVPSHVVRKSLHVEYTLFSAAHPPDFPRSPRPAWAGFRPQARVTSVHDTTVVWAFKHHTYGNFQTERVLCSTHN